MFLGTRGNQSLRGVLTRLAWAARRPAPRPGSPAPTLVLVLGLAAAARPVPRLGHPVPGMLACALTGLLVSPLSWDHHWVWVAPGLALLAHLGAQARGAVRACVGGRPRPSLVRGVRRLAAVLGPRPRPG